MDNTIHIADMHCHILPAVDDGSRNFEQTVSMLRIAYEEGVRLIIATPHYHIGKMMVTPAKADAAAEKVRLLVKEQFPGMELYIGQEIYYYSDAIEAIEKGEAGTMACSRYILMEYSIDESFDVIDSSVYEAMTHGYIPILAHIERYGCLFNRPERIKQLIDSGAYIQVNASSVCGNNGRDVKKYIKKLLKQRMIHFVASDAHSDRSRAPRFKDTVKTLERICKPDYLMELLWDNSVKIINDEEI